MGLQETNRDPVATAAKRHGVSDQARALYAASTEGFATS